MSDLTRRPNVVRVPRRTWDEYAAEVERENEAQKAALRRFKQRQAAPRPLTLNQRAALGFAWFIVKVIFWSAVAGLFVWKAFQLPG